MGRVPGHFSVCEPPTHANVPTAQRRGYRAQRSKRRTAGLLHLPYIEPAVFDDAVYLCLFLLSLVFIIVCVLHGISQTVCKRTGWHGWMKLMPSACLGGKRHGFLYVTRLILSSCLIAVGLLSCCVSLV